MGLLAALALHHGGTMMAVGLSDRLDLSHTYIMAINSGQGSGVTVAIMERGELVYSEAFGVADRAQNRAVDRNTRFNIGSVSKMFAAVAILLLVDDGKVKPDAPFVRYIPEFTMD